MCRVELHFVPGIAVSAIINLWVRLFSLSYILRHVTLFGSYLLTYRVVGLRKMGRGKAVPLQAWSGPEDSRKLFPDFMTTAQGGGKDVSITHRPHLPPGNPPGTHFCYRLSRPQGHSAIGWIMSLKNSNYTIGNRATDLPICSAAP